MLRFLGSWLADCVHVTCMLAGALGAMQIPAVTHAYVAALVQVAQDARRDIDRREGDARQYYHLSPDADEQAIITALRPVEPSNAATLTLSVVRAAMFNSTYLQIITTPPVGQPIVAAWDAIQRPESDKLAVLRTSFVTYVPQIALDEVLDRLWHRGAAIGWPAGPLPDGYPTNHLASHPPAFGGGRLMRVW